MCTGLCKDMSSGMCADMCTDICTDMCTDMCTNMDIDTYGSSLICSAPNPTPNHTSAGPLSVIVASEREPNTDSPSAMPPPRLATVPCVCVDMCVDMSADRCTGICTDVCVDMCVDVCRRVCRHVCRHVCEQVAERCLGGRYWGRRRSSQWSYRCH